MISPNKCRYYISHDEYVWYVMRINGFRSHPHFIDYNPFEWDAMTFASRMNDKYEGYFLLTLYWPAAVHCDINIFESFDEF